jgi:hypothetical protein
MVLETKFRTATGTLSLVDGLAVGRNERGHELGADSPHVLLRRVTCLEGKAEIAVEYAPRPEYGLIHPLLAQVEGGVAARGGAERLALSTPVEMNIRGSQAQVRISLEEGDTVAFALQHRASWEEPPGRGVRTRYSAGWKTQLQRGARGPRFTKTIKGLGRSSFTPAGGFFRPSPFSPPAPSLRSSYDLEADLLLCHVGVHGHLRQASSSVPLLVPHLHQDVRNSFPDMVGSKDCLELGDQAPKGFRRPRGASQLMDQDLKRVYGVELYALLSQECPDLDFGSLSLRLASRTSVG